MRLFVASTDKTKTVFSPFLVRNNFIKIGETEGLYDWQLIFLTSCSDHLSTKTNHSFHFLFLNKFFNLTLQKNFIFH